MMGDHMARARRNPPGTLDHADMNATQVVVCAISVLVSAVIIVDVPRDAWSASYSLQYVPPITQVSIAVLLFGGVPAVFGILARPRKWKPLGSILVEALGWLSLTLGWLSFGFAVMEHSRQGSFIPLVLSFGIALASSWEFSILLRAGLSEYRENQQIKRDGENTRKVRGV